MKKLTSLVDPGNELLPETKFELQKKIDHFINNAIENKTEFLSILEKKKIVFMHMKRMYTDWKRPAQCRIPSCEKMSICRSHTLQRMGPLANISERGMVCTPHFKADMDNGKVIEIGYKDASVFSGFCQKHEKIFDVFESKKAIESEFDNLLQIYRSVSREAARLAFDVKYYRSLNNALSEAENQSATRMFLASSENLLKHYPIIRNFKLNIFRYDVAKIEADLLNLEMDITYINRKILSVLENVTGLDGSDVNLAGTMDIGVFYRSIDIDIDLPITLSGRSRLNFKDKDKKQTYSILAFIIVIPQSGRTRVLIASSTEDGTILNAYLLSAGIITLEGSHNSTKLIRFIEKFIVFGTDHWFMKPSYWRQLDTAVKKAIEENITNYTDDFENEEEIEFLPRKA